MKNLPCFPCPHLSVCCKYGVDLETTEALLIQLEHGVDKVYVDIRQAIDNSSYRIFRTSVVDGKCVFQENNSCKIHNKLYYPIACRSFPEDHPEEERLICPEFHASKEAFNKWEQSFLKEEK